MQRSFSLARTLLLVASLAAPLAAQGTPPDQQDPDVAGGPGSWGGPGDTVPEPTPVSVPTPGGGPAGAPGAPTPSRAALAAPAAPGTPIVVGPTETLPAPDRSLWQTWWEFNKDPYLAVKASLYSGDLETGTDDFFLGEGASTETGGSLRPDADLVFGSVAPALLRVLEEERQNDLLGAALIALGRIGRPPEGSELAIESALRAFVDHSNSNVGELAVLALGIYGDDASVFALANLLEGDARALRKGREGVPARQRAYAAYALGLIGSRTKNEDVRRYVVHQLTRGLEVHESGPLDVPVACAEALGIVPLAVEPGYHAGERADSPTRCRQSQVAWLLARESARGTKFLVRAHLVTSLGRLVRDVPESTGLRERVARVCLDILGPRARDPREVRQSAALALGSLGDGDADVLDVEIRRTLQRVGTATGDPTVRHFAQVALAQVGSRPGHGQGEPLEGRREVATFLRKELHAGRSTSRPWTALAAGVFGRDLADVGVALDAETRASVVQGLDDVNSTRDLGAFSISAGLCGAAEATARLTGLARDHGDDATAGYAALGIGLMGARVSGPTLTEVVEASRFRPLRLEQAAIALVLLGDRQIGPRLVDLLAEAGSFSSQSSIARALGEAGDARVVPRLVELLEDDQSTDLARAYAAVALGLSCEQDMLPWRHRYSVGVNYLANTPTLTGNRGILDLP